MLLFEDTYGRGWVLDVGAISLLSLFVYMVLKAWCAGCIVSLRLYKGQ